MASRQPSLHRRKDLARFRALAAFLKEERISRKMTTRELAKAATLQQSLIVEVEAGRRTLSVFDLMRIAKPLHLSWSKVAAELEGLINEAKLNGPKVATPRRSKMPTVAPSGPATP
jgi:transcriptional regulator with XRE-family HTH domain